MLRIVENWKRNDEFDLTARLNSINQPSIEIGGPTESGFPLIDRKRIRRQPLISNVTKGAPTFNQCGELTHYYGKVDFQADGQKLPFSSRSIGVIRADSLPPHIFESVIDEAGRVLVGGGILILQGLDSSDVLFVTRNGFTLLQYKLKDGEPYYSIFEKK